MHKNEAGTEVDPRDALLDEIEKRLRSMTEAQKTEDLRLYASELLQHLRDARTDLQNIERDS